MRKLTQSPPGFAVAIENTLRPITSNLAEEGIGRDIRSLKTYRHRPQLNLPHLGDDHQFRYHATKIQPFCLVKREHDNLLGLCKLARGRRKAVTAHQESVWVTDACAG